MTYKEWLDWYNKEPFDYPPNARDGWLACKREIIKLLEQNKELEFVSYSGKKVYRIYDSVVEKIKKEI